MVAVLVGAALALAGCATTGALPASVVGPSTVGGWPVDVRDDSRAQDSRAQFIVLHYTDEDTPRSLRILSGDKVSAHYVVTDETPPRIVRLVPEHRRAWHAGDSAWGAFGNLNAHSIGIEIVNAGALHDAAGRVVDFAPYPDAQVDAVLALVRDLAQRHGVRPDRVVGHSDIAPQRKIDPGPRFPWARLADAGLVVWPDAARVAQARAALAAAGDATPPVAWFQRALARHGFKVPDHGSLDAATRAVLRAFQMKYRPARHDGAPDVETAALLQALTGLDAAAATVPPVAAGAPASSPPNGPVGVPAPVSTAR